MIKINGKWKHNEKELEKMKRGKIVQSICKKCKKCFSHYRWDKQNSYCSKKCYYNRGVNELFYSEKKCDFCKKSFKYYKHQLLRKYCSLECHRKSKHEKLKQNCTQCNREFYSIKQKKRVFCSKKCLSGWLKFNYTGKKRIFSKESYDRWLLIMRSPMSIERRRIAFLGERNPNWQGGLSFLFYNKDFSRQFKQLIILRDSCCLICGKNIRLHIHHIDYNKLNTTKENCCALCNSCHTKTNFNRTQWTQFFRSLLVEKYNYCYITKEVSIENGIP